MTLDQLRARFPRASDAFLRKNAQALETLTPGQIKDACMRLNLGLIPPGTEVSTTGAPVVVGKNGVKRLRQSAKPLLNKLETALLHHLEDVHGGSVKFYAQAFRVKLANGAWYKPDLSAWVRTRLMCWEAKCFKGKRVARERGIQALKVAAHMYPEIDWYICSRKGGAWNIQKVLP